ncbi:MAG: hypothetical protein K8R54_17315 [Bacteroidales bacterium]|nr:hypothetical protein [Bacteroidales bacterium]
MKNKFLVKNLLVLIFMVQFSLFAQDSPRLITISKTLGNVIDAKEKTKYALFDEYTDDEFKEAKFFKNPDKSLFLVIYFKDGTKNKRLLTEAEYYAYKKHIEKRKINYNEIDSTMFCVVKLTDESSISGKVISVFEKEIEVKTKYLGQIIIPKKNITEIVVLKSYGKQANKFWLPNPHDSRHFFSPTARNLPKGEGYFQDIYLVFLFSNYGITDYLTIGGGCSIIPGLGIDEQAYFFNTKIGFNLNEKFSLGGGILYGNIPYTEEVEIPEEITIPIANTFPERDTTVFYNTYEYYYHRKNAGILFGVGTYGTSENNLTFGMGYAYIEDNPLKNPIYMLGGMFRLSRRTALITENWLFFEDHSDGTFASPLISYGIRFFGEKMSLDFAFIQAPGEKWIDKIIFPGIPYLDFVLKF